MGRAVPPAAPAGRRGALPPAGRRGASRVHGGDAMATATGKVPWGARSATFGRR
jgi:hypothetical protein